VGFIFFGLRRLSSEENEAILRRVCKLNWKLTVGVDFVQ
jgi:adenosine deaminase